MADQYPFSPSASPDSEQNPRPEPPQPPSVQPPPPPPITIRTMESDIKSMQASGGTPIPQQVKPNELKIPAPSEEPVFSPQTAGQPQLERKSLPPWLKISALIAGALVLIAGFGALGYYIVYPLIFPPQVQLPTAETPPPPPLPTEQPAPKQLAPEQPAPKQPTALTHASFFSVPANQTETLTIAAITAEAIKEALTTSAAQALATSSIKEITFKTADGLVTAPEFLSAALPVFTAQEIETNFEDDFTAYLYYDQNGVWPGFIFRLKDTAILFEAQALVEKIETAAVTALKNIYVADPGKASAETFRNGQLKGKATKYLPFELPGASLNYGIIGNYFMLSTSYAGIQEAANRLGL